MAVRYRVVALAEVLTGRVKTHVVRPHTLILPLSLALSCIHAVVLYRNRRCRFRK